MIKDVNVRTETIKVLEENIGCTLTSVLSSFKKYISSGKGSKNKNKQMELHQAKKLCTAKETINRMKRQPMEWKKIFENYILDKGLISKIYKKLLQFNTKK